MQMHNNVLCDSQYFVEYSIIPIVRENYSQNIISLTEHCYGSEQCYAIEVQDYISNIHQF